MRMQPAVLLILISFQLTYNTKIIANSNMT